MKIPLVDLRASYLPIREELLAEIDRSLQAMQLFLGPHTRALERDFAEFCETAEGVAVSSGTDALIAALEACGVGPGDEVIVPTLTFFATIEAVIHAGATPVLVDVEPGTLTMDPTAIPGALGPATRAIVPVHLYGHPADMDPILEIARAGNLKVIEDAAQAHGARYRGRRCGSMGHAAAFSFYFTKNLGAFGEGGFVATGDPDVARAVRLHRDHGSVTKYEHAMVGRNLRMDELQALVLRLKLRRLEESNARRRAIARRYRERFRGAEVQLVHVDPACESVHHLEPLRVADRDGLVRWLAEREIGTGIHYATPAHLQPALADLSHRAGPFPVAEGACASLVSIPIYPELSDAQVDDVAEQVLRFLERGAGRAGAA